MHNREYGLGIDIGDGTITAAVCRRDDETRADAEALSLGAGSPLAPAAVRVAADDSVRFDNAFPGVQVPGEYLVGHVMARVGAPTPLRVGDRQMTAAELVAAIAACVRAVAEAHQGRRPTVTVLAVPPSWSDYRRTLLADALRAADAAPFSLISSAVAATYHHVARADLPTDARVAVYDLGASTLDTAVVGPTPDDGLDHVAVPPAPVAWGGRDIDDVLLGHVLDNLDGELLGGDGDLARLRALRQATVAAKETLSSDTVAQLDAETCGAPLRVTREEVDELIDMQVQESVDVITEAIAGAGLQAEDLDGVVLAGGGVRVPLVAERLSSALGLPLIVEETPALTTALGAARWAVDALLGASVDTTAGERAGDDGARPAGSRFVRRRTARPRPGAPAAPPAAHGATRVPRRSPAGRPARRGVSRAAIVVGMFLGLVALPPSLFTMLWADRTSPTSSPGVADAIEPQAAAAAPTSTGNPFAGTSAGFTSEVATGETTSLRNPQPGSTAQRSTAGRTGAAAGALPTADAAATAAGEPAVTATGQPSVTPATPATDTSTDTSEPAPGPTTGQTTDPVPEPTIDPTPTDPAPTTVQESPAVPVSDSPTPEPGASPVEPSNTAETEPPA